VVSDIAQTMTEASIPFASVAFAQSPQTIMSGVSPTLESQHQCDPVDVMRFGHLNMDDEGQVDVKRSRRRCC
jgi:hypothetical protein